MMQPKDTKNLCFNLINQGYLSSLYELHSNPKVMKFVRAPDESLEDTQRTIDLQLANAKRYPGMGLFCAHRKKTKEFVGWGYIYHLDFDEALAVEVGYRLSPHFWGNGYATQIAQALTDYGHRELDVHKLCAVTDPNHIVSKRVLEKVGFQYIDNRQAYGHQCSYFEHTYSSLS